MLFLDLWQNLLDKILNFYYSLESYLLLQQTIKMSIPNDKKNIFQIGDFIFDFQEDKTSMSISDRVEINSAPSFYSSYVNTHLFKGEAKVLENNEELLEDLYETYDEPINELSTFEYAINAYGFSQHEHPELQASLSVKGNPEDWIILLTVTSAGEMQWGDAGDLFFVIHKRISQECKFINELCLRF